MDKKIIFNDVISSFTVLLVALPVALGVAVASGTPPIFGIFTAIIGALIVTPLSGSPLQISAPSTGLAVMVLHVVQTFGLQALIPLGIITGIFQVIIAAKRWGHLFQATPPSLVTAMLSGIGFLLILSQLYILLGFELSGQSYVNIIEFPYKLTELFSADMFDPVVFEDMIIASIVIIFMISWRTIPSERIQKVPSSILGIILASFVANFFDWEIKHVPIPANFFTLFRDINYLDSMMSIDFSFVAYAIGFSFVASVETMLCVTALDQITHEDSNYNKTIFSQGIGNLIAGLIGTIPVVGVISRSAANLDAGTKSKVGGFVHGIWMVLLLFIPFVIEFIPTAALLGLLMFIGGKLLDPYRIYIYAKNYNKTSLIFFTTFILTITLDLLIGVIAGFFVASGILLFDVLKFDLMVEEKRGNKVLKFTGKLSFLDLPTINKELSEHTENIPSNIEVCLREVQYIDPAIQKKLELLKEKLEKKGHKVNIKH